MNIQPQQFESWPERDVPPFSDIKVIGCCEEHEKNGDFEWYRVHTWKDLRELMLTNTDTLNWPGIDIFQFSSLDERVWRYYAKGVLSALAEIVLKESSFDNIPFEFWQWISHKKGVEGVSFEKIIPVSELSKKEVEDITALVKKIAELPHDDGEYTKYAEDIQNTLLFWEKYAKAFDSVLK